MATHRHIDKICLAAVILSLALMLIFTQGESLGILPASRSMGYEDLLFDTSQVHTVEIVMDDWDKFIDTCENEQYAACSVIIDGEAYKNVGIRAKGNTSLSRVSELDSERYSFKIEFDQYDNTKSYHGLDKLCLNNIIQDNTYMKDYLTYRMMGEFGVAAPLCSYVYITVNGEEWGLYLAVESIEDSFLQRNYGTDYGNLYKPDAIDMGGGRGNGKAFDMENFMEGKPVLTDEDAVPPTNAPGGEPPAEEDENAAPSIDAVSPETPPAEQATQQPTAPSYSSGSLPPSPPTDQRSPEKGFGGMQSDDVKLQYIDDNPDSYANIFNNAKTDITDADKERLIQSLKDLSEEKDIENTVDVEAVIRYFVVHNFVCNGDSYTGQMIHNYYLYEKDGQLSMLPWDYNLAFGAFQSADATETVNIPIDTPVDGGTGEDRPMIHWIFSNEEYTARYHQYFSLFLQNTDFETLIDETAALIAPYVDKDPTKFCTVEEFKTGVSALREFCLLREASVAGQLNNTIPSTADGQSANPSALIDTSHLSLSATGSMNLFGGKMARGSFHRPDGNLTQPEESAADSPVPSFATQTGNIPENDKTDIPPAFIQSSPAQNDSAGAVAPTGQILLLCVSLFILFAGLLVVFRFKR